MRWNRPLILVSLLTVASPSAANAQRTWIVDDDPGASVDFATPQDALAVAQPGDVVFVRTGWYTGSIDVTRGVRLIGQPGADVSTPSSTLTISSVPAGEVAVVSGFPSLPVEVSGCPGTVVIDGGDAVSPGARFVRRVVSSADVRVRSQVVWQSVGSRVEVVQPPEFEGGTLAQPASVAVHGSRFHLVHGRVWGLRGADQSCALCSPATEGAPGIYAVSSQLILTSSDIQGGDGGWGFWGPAGDGPGGPGVQALGGYVRASDCTILSGNGFPTTPPPIELLNGAVEIDPAPRIDPSLVATGPQRPGDTIELVVRSVPGDVVRLLTGSLPEIPSMPGSAVERLVVPDRDNVIGVIPASGELQADLPILPHWRVGDVVFCQVVSVDSAGVEHYSNSLPVIVRAHAAPAGLGEVVCEGLPNSTGIGAKLGVWGSTTIAAADLRFPVADLPPGSAAFLFFGSTSYTSAALAGGGRPCVGGSVVHRRNAPGHVRIADALGRVEFRVDPNLPLGPWLSFQPGGTLVVQTWYRDVAGGTTTFNFSSAARFTMD